MNIKLADIQRVLFFGVAYWVALLRGLDTNHEALLLIPDVETSVTFSCVPAR